MPVYNGQKAVDALLAGKATLSQANAGKELPFFNAVADAIGASLNSMGVGVGEGEDKDPKEAFNWFQSLIKTYGVDPAKLNDLGKLMEKFSFSLPLVGDVTSLLFTIFTFPTLIDAVIRPIGTIISRGPNSLIRPGIIDYNTIVNLIYRRGIPPSLINDNDIGQHVIEQEREKVLGDMDKVLGYHGFTPDVVRETMEAGKPKAEIDTILSLYARGLISRNQSIRYLAGMGFDKGDMETLFLSQTGKIGMGSVQAADNRGFFDLFTQQINWYKREEMGDEDSWRMARQLKNQIPGSIDLREMLKRGIITEEDFFRLIKGTGLSAECVYPFIKRNGLSKQFQNDPDPIRNNIASLRWQLPTPTDMVQFAVKEAFNFPVANSFGNYNEYPGDDRSAIDKRFTEPFKNISYNIAQSKTVGDFFKSMHEAIGIPEPVMRMQWAQHWNLPAPGQVYDMFFRGLVDQNTVNNYLKSADYSPFWREKMLGIQYSLIPRSELEQLLRFGVIDQYEHMGGLEKIGYTREDADKLTVLAARRSFADQRDRAIDNVMSAYRLGTVEKSEARGLLNELQVFPDAQAYLFADSDRKRETDETLIEATGVANQADEARDVTKRDILRGYNVGLIGRDEASDMLKAIGFTSVAAEFLIEREELNKFLKDREDRKKLISKQYLEGVIEEDELVRQLQNSGFPTAIVVQTVDDLQFELDANERLETKRDRTATQSQLENWLKKGVIELDQWLEKMKELKYDDFTINAFLTEIILDMQE